LSTYSFIRWQDNICLVAGSGFGGSDDFWPYLGGDWSIRFGVQPMLLMAFFWLVAKEAHISLSVKYLIVAAPAVVDTQWEGTCMEETGSILTVQSGLGELTTRLLCGT